MRVRSISGLVPRAALLVVLAACGDPVQPAPIPDGGPARDGGPDNRAPAFEAGPNRLEVPENQEGPFAAVVATDPDDDALTYLLEGPDAERLRIGPTGALGFVVPPDFEAPLDADRDNVHRLDVVADDGALSARRALEVVVLQVNEFDPVFTSGGRATAAENQLETDYVAAAEDGDGQPVAFSVSGGPDADAFALSPEGALRLAAPLDFEVPTDADGDNRYAVELEADDGDGRSARQRVVVEITDALEPPRFTSPAVASSPEGRVETGYVVQAEPAQGGPLVYGLGDGPDGPDGSAFMVEAATGVLLFVSPPDFEAPGDVDGDNVYRLTVTASEGELTATATVALAVTDVNEPPVFSGPSDFMVAEGDTEVGTVQASDPEGGPVELALSGTDAASLVVDPASGRLAFGAAPDFEAPADADRDNVYRVELRATAAGQSTPRSARITVTDVDEPPVFTSATSISVAENRLGTGLSVQARDPEGQTIRYAVAGGADAAALAVDASTGALRFARAPDFEAPGDAGGDNVYDVVVSAAAGTGTATVALALSVTDVDEAPVFSSVATATAAENQTDPGYRPAAVDPEGRSLSFSLGGPDATRFVFDAGRLTFAAAPDYEQPGDADGDNVYVLAVTASDGGLSATQTATITLVDLDEPPVFRSGGSVSVPENRADTGYRAEAVDPEGAAVGYTVTGTDAARFTLSGDRLLFAAAPDFEAPGDADRDNLYAIAIEASDGTNTARRAVTVEVTDVPRGVTADFPLPGALLGGVTTTAVSGTLTDAPASTVSSVSVDGVTATLVPGTPLRFRASVSIGPSTTGLPITARFTSGPDASAAVTVDNQAILANAGAVAASAAAAYVVDPNRSAIVQVVLSNGERTELSGPGRGTGFLFPSAEDLVLDSAGSRLLLLDDRRDSLFAIDLASGDRSEVSTPGDPGPDLELPRALVLDAAGGRALVTDDFLDALIEVDLGTGARREISGPNAGTGPRLSTPQGVAYDPVGATAWVTEARDDVVIAVDVRNGDRTVVSSATRGTGVAFVAPRGIVYDGTRLLVTDEARGRVIAVDPSTGDRTLLVDDTLGRGPDLQTPRSFVLTSTRTALIADFGVGLVQADLVNGDTSVRSAPSSAGSGARVVGAADLAYDAVGQRLLVLDDGFSSRALVAVDAQTLARSVLSGSTVGSGPRLSRPARIAVGEGEAYLTDRTGAAVISVDLSSGDRQVVSDGARGSGTTLSAPVALTLGSGTAYVGDRDLDAILSVDLGTGNRSVVSGTGSGVDDPRDLALDAGAGLVLVAEGGPTDGILAIELATGASTVVSSSAFGAAVGAGPDMNDPVSVGRGAGNTAYVLDERSATLLSVDRATGDRVALSGGGAGSGPPLLEPRAATVDGPRGRVFVLEDELGVEGLVLVDLVTGQRAIIAR